MRKRKKSRIRVLGKLVILIFAVWSALTLMTLQGQINQKKAERDGIEALLAEQRIRNATLSEDIKSDNVEEKYARIARDRLGLVDPSEIIIVNRNP
jgi:cell division protein FtsB